MSIILPSLILPDKVNLLPREDSRPYFEALSAKPTLVKTESDENCFLRLETLDKAAIRVARYWKLRKLLFGEKWLSKIVLSEDGCFDTEDLKAIEEGFGSVLPNDERHRSVIFLDPSRIVDPSPQIIRRILFWLLQRVSSNPHSQSEGIIFVIQLLSLTEELQLVHIIQDLSQAFPVRIKQIHLSSRAIKKKESVGLKNQLPKQVQLHVFATKTQGRKIFLSLGFHIKGIPSTFGGKWTFETDFQDVLAIDRRSFRTSEETLNDHDKNLAERDLVDRVLENDPSSRDIHSASPSLVTLDGDDVLRARLVEAVKALPFQVSSDCQKALECCPDLFLQGRESDPILYIRFTGGNVEKAAHRISRYWTERASLFGNRAFLPLTQTGSGALTTEEIEILRNGYLVKLPPRKDTEFVFCQDHDRLPSWATTDQRLRCGMYLLATASQDNPDVTSIFGFHIIGARPSFSLSHANRGRHIMFQAIPFEFEEYNILYSPESTSLSFFDYILPTLVNHAAYLTQKRVRIRTGRTPEDLLRQCMEKGFKRDGLPPKVGGTWSYESFLQWLDSRAQKELEIYPPLENPSLIASGGDQIVVGIDYGISESPAEIHRKRRVVYSRRQRKRRKDEMDVLSKTYSLGQQENNSLKVENTRLVRLVELANEQVRLHQSNDRARSSIFGFRFGSDSFQ